ncbi:energy-coupling factor transporter transmembrane protein EcfT [candidate division KSB1 bacterium]|nr:energy-coupling factor transporter transmembrane protein EcfT [candidate division KSB1 bacterium]
MSILLLGISSSVWAIAAQDYVMPIIWLVILLAIVSIDNPHEFQFFLKRFSQIGVTLISISLLQIIFRRAGTVVLAVHQFPLVYSEGLREAILLWIRFMILFVLARVFAQVSLFHFLLFMNKSRFSLEMSLLLLTTLKLIPFIFTEAKRALWFLCFRGINIRQLSLRHKFWALKKLLYPLLMRGMHYTSYSALALELRGYGKRGAYRIPQAYPLQGIDWILILFIIGVNSIGIFQIF